MMRARPIVVDIGTLRPSCRDRRQVFSFRPRQVQPLRWQHPNIDIQANLMRSMPCQHWPAPWLRYVANVQAFPARQLGRELGKSLDILDRLWMAPITISAQAHGLPGWSCFRQLNAACQASLGIAAMRRNAQAGRFRFCAKQLFRQWLCSRDRSA